MRELTKKFKEGMKKLITTNYINEEDLKLLPEKVKEYGKRKPYSEPLDCPHLSIKKESKGNEDKQCDK